MLALLSALLVFRLLPRGFAIRDLREHWAPLLGEDPSQLTQGRMTFQLRRLRLHGLIVRQAGTHRYAVTDVGLRMALFFTRSYPRVLRPGLAEVGAEALPNDPPLRRAFARLEQAMLVGKPWYACTPPGTGSSSLCRSRARGVRTSDDQTFPRNSEAKPVAGTALP